MRFYRTKLSCPLLLLTLKIACCIADCTPTKMAEENSKKLSVANNHLALELYQRLTAKSSDNVFFSPLSISTAFAMLFYGTREHTAEELRTALGYKEANLTNELVHSTFHCLLTSELSKQDDKVTKNCLKLANSLLLDKKAGFLPDYKENVQNLYQASIQDVDFHNEAAKIVSEVNSWVRNKTNGKIDQILDHLDPSTAMVILNAIYFKGTWKKEFEKKNTKPQKFYNDGLESGATDVNTMYLESRFPYATIDNMKVLELPYKGEDISMILLLPNQQNGLASLENTMTVEKLSFILTQLRRTSVKVSLPKFKLQYSREMSSDMKSLGARIIFNSVMADFSGMTTARDVFVSQVLHEAVIEVNEEGSEAAAVTKVIQSRRRPIAPPIIPEFKADHPFMFAIVKKRDDMVLFMGRVNKL